MFNKIKSMIILLSACMVQLRAPELSFAGLAGNLVAECKITEEQGKQLEVKFPDELTHVSAREFLQEFPLDLSVETIQNWIEYHATFVRGHFSPQTYQLNCLIQSPNIFLYDVESRKDHVTFKVGGPNSIEFNITLNLGTKALELAVKIASNYANLGKPIHDIAEFNEGYDLKWAGCAPTNFFYPHESVWTIDPETVGGKLNISTLNRLIDEFALKILDSETTCNEKCKFILARNPGDKRGSRRTELYPNSGYYKHFAQIAKDGILRPEFVSRFAAVFTLGIDSEQFEVSKLGNEFTVSFRPQPGEFRIGNVYFGLRYGTPEFKVEMFDPILGNMTVGTANTSDFIMNVNNDLFGPDLHTQASLEGAVKHILDFCVTQNPSLSSRKYIVALPNPHYDLETDSGAGWDRLLFDINDPEQVAQSFEDMNNLRTLPIFVIKPGFNPVGFWKSRTID